MGMAGEKKATRLTFKDDTTLPIEAECITPDLLAGASRDEIAALPAYRGRRRLTLGDLFAIEPGVSGDVVVEGDLSRVKRMGQDMTTGRLIIHGNAGAHLGAGMRGGGIMVHGDCGDYAGAHMKGGLIRIAGDAGHHTAAAYPGQTKGVDRGVVVIHGNAGVELGARMRRGIIVVMGDTGDFTGAGVISGTIIVFGRTGARAGAGNKRGSIVAAGGIDEILPTYVRACAYSPVFLRCYFKRLREWGLELPAGVEGTYQRYAGDMNTLGKGEILVLDQPQ